MSTYRPDDGADRAALVTLRSYVARWLREEADFRDPDYRAEAQRVLDETDTP